MNAVVDWIDNLHLNWTLYWNILTHMNLGYPGRIHGYSYWGVSWILETEHVKRNVYIPEYELSLKYFKR